MGTIGLVRASREQEDGTSQLLLHGVMRVRFIEWHVDLDYPFATIEPVVSTFTPEHQSLAAMKTLRDAPGTSNDRTIRYSADSKALEIRMGGGQTTRFWYGPDGQRYLRL